MDGPGGTPFTKLGFYGSWLRHCAYYLGKQNFAAIDLVIPMAYISNGPIDENSISYIVISVKNGRETEHIKMEYLTRESVEGVPQKERPSKQRKISQQSVPKKDKERTIACDESINLTLHSLMFINPEGTIGEMERSDSTWIETSAEKPYVAFLMTMGNPDQIDNLFIAEKNVFSLGQLSSDVLEILQRKSHCVCRQRTHE